MKVKRLKDKLDSFPINYEVTLDGEFIIKLYVDHSSKTVKIYTDKVKPPEELTPPAPARRETTTFSGMTDENGQLILF